MKPTSLTVITRFAPSPTGHLHIGGARTALFCWAFARRMGGHFLLRIEDTDQARSSEASARGIMEDLAWLGIEWDEGPELARKASRHQGIEASSEEGKGSGTIGGDPRGVAPFYQSQRLDLYNRILNEMIERGTAYADFTPAAKIDEMRKAASAAKETFRYRPATGDILPVAEQKRRMSAGEPHVVRLRTPEETVHVMDEVLGEVKFASNEVDDFVLRKADGFPTYHFGVVVDDETMGVTHVLRGQEHLMNTPRHAMLQRALGYRTPVYAHMPLIFNDQGAKMSKRERDQAARAAMLQVMKELPPAGQWFMTARLWAELGDLAPTTKQQRRSIVEQLVASGATPEKLAAKTGHALVDEYFPHLSSASREVYASHINGLHRLMKYYGDTVVQEWLKDKKRQLESQQVDRLEEILSQKFPEVSVQDFRKAGYLPEVICNFIALLGWNPGLKNADGTNLERFDMEFLAKNFDLPRIGKTNARFDRKKLMAFNADALGAMTDEQFAARWREWCARFDPRLIEKLDEQRFVWLARAVKPRCKTLADAMKPAAFVLLDDDAVVFDEAAVKKHVLAPVNKDGTGPMGIDVLRELAGVIETVEPFEPGAINAAIEAFAASKGLQIGAVAQPLRVALTGTGISPGLGETLAVLGKRGVTTRIARCIEESTAP